MNHSTFNKNGTKRSILHYSYLVTILFLTLTGFGQMPIFKRYYIADIPGFGWLAKFYITHYMHYLFAILLIGIVAFVITDYLLFRRKHIRITRSGYLRGVILTGLMITGILLVIRNFPGSGFSPGFIIFLDLCHLGLVMAFLVTAGYCVVFKKKWLQPL